MTIYKFKVGYKYKREYWPDTNWVCIDMDIANNEFYLRHAYLDQICFNDLIAHDYEEIKDEN